MLEVDIGVPSDAVFTGVDEDVEGHRLASFVTDDGSVFSLDHEAVHSRIEYLVRHEMPAGEEHKALSALAG